ncbi:hypothetical protein [Nonomuraea sp. NPDC050643]|uniref:hypothetical protein n=1 Tax=Nonomuraea sp. NPDC050643 TaxID=3155660 RepID=UPI003401347E
MWVVGIVGQELFDDGQTSAEFLDRAMGSLSSYPRLIHCWAGYLQEQLYQGMAGGVVREVSHEVTIDGVLGDIEGGAEVGHAHGSGAPTRCGQLDCRECLAYSELLEEPVRRRGAVPALDVEGGQELRAATAVEDLDEIDIADQTAYERAPLAGQVESGRDLNDMLSYCPPECGLYTHRVEQCVDGRSLPNGCGSLQPNEWSAAEVKWSTNICAGEDF